MRNPADQLGIRRSGGGKTTPCCSKVGIKRGPWTAEEDEILTGYIKREGEGAWRTLPKRAGLLRCGKSCRLRWMNYLRPHLNRGPISPDEEDLILRLHRLLGNRWSLIAGRIPGRTDNEIKNYWNTHLSKKLISQGLDPRNHKPLECYNPNPNNCNSPSVSVQTYNNNDNGNNKDEDANYHQVRSSSTPAEDSMDPTPNPNPILATAHDGLMIMAGYNSTISQGFDSNRGEINHDNCSTYNDEMYFSSFLDSLIMNEEECVFQQPDHDHKVLIASNDSNNISNHMFQDQSMMMTMIQPLGYGTSTSTSQGFIDQRGSAWGSDHHEVSPLMASGFSNYQGDRNLDPANMNKQ